MTTVPSFSSFPDLDGSSVEQSKSSGKRKERGNSPNHEGTKTKKRHEKGQESSKEYRRHREDEVDSRRKHRKRAEVEPVDFSRPSTSKYGTEEKAEAYDPTPPSHGVHSVWFVDRKGDQNNVTFGGPYLRSVPKFRRFGYGRVLGLPLGFKVIKKRKEDHVVPLHRRSDTHYTSSRSRLLLPATKTRLLVNLHDQPQSPVDDTGFIPLLKSRSRKDTDTSDPTLTYRSITQSKNPPSDSDIDSESDSSDANYQFDDSSSNEENSPPQNSHTQTSRSLNSTLLKDPRSISTWLRLVSHETSISTTAHARDSIALSIMERAMSAHPSNRASETLRLKYLRCGKSIWDKASLRKQWDSALREVRGETLWVDYIGFKLAEDGVKGLEGALGKVWSEIRGESKADERMRLTLFWRACIALREAGYSERAIAAFQVEIEMSYFPPSDSSSLPFAACLSAFESFWDSECPRVGEIGAKGWATWAGTKTGPPEDLKEEQMLPISSESDPYVRWSIDERRKEQSGLLPRRTSETDDSDDDPYSAILFDDVRPFLFPPPRSSEVRTLLLYIFLDFLGLHIPGLAYAVSNARGESDTLWSDTRFSSHPTLRLELFYFPGKSQDKRQLPSSSLLELESVIGKERKMREGWGAVKEWGFGSVRPLDGWGVKGEGRMWESKDVEGVDERLIRRLFEQTTSVQSSVEWNQLWLAFEAVTSIKSSVKISKTLLSQHRVSFPLWASHAKLERMRGKIGDARKVYEACWSSSASEMISDKNLLYDWAEMEWLEGKHEDAGKVLSRIVDVDWNGVGSGLSLLRVKKAFDRLIQGSSGADSVSVLVKSRALLELLTTGDVASALRIYEPYLSTPSSNLESLLLSSSLLIYHHTVTLSRPSPPILLRSHVEKAIRQFPNNTLLLGVWLQCERGQAVWGRVRRTVADVVLDRENGGVCLSRWAWAVWVETWERGAWEVERVRNLLSQAVEDENARSSPSLWRLYIELEVGLGDFAKARSLLYRAIAECPWVKDFYLLAFGPLRSTFTPTELNAWVNTMAERSIRVRLNIEEYLEEWKEKASESSESGEEEDGAMEIESRARERRRLMPY